MTSSRALRRSAPSMGSRPHHEDRLHLVHEQPIVDVRNRLSPKERDELEALLEARNPEGPLARITGLHGFLTCVVSGPMLLPSEWLPAIFGDDDERRWKDLDQAQRAMGLLMRFYNEVASDIAGEGHRYRILVDRIGDPPKTFDVADNWCRGFVLGMSLRESEWDGAMNDDDLSLAFDPIVSALTPEIVDDIRRDDPQKYAKLIDALPDAVIEIRDWWREKLSQTPWGRAPAPVRRATPKISPNAPCPCGSGKKYKRCCSPHTQSGEPPLSPRAESESAESRVSHKAPRPPQTRKVWKITIRLRNVMPIVWRTIMVRPETKLVMLHRYLQAAMGWSDYHLFAFKIGTKEYGIPHPEMRHTKIYDARRYTLERLFPELPTSFEYIYDFGDNWEHLIEIEQEEDAIFRQRYPICTAGAEPCPPEDCGGPGAWAELRTALNNPNHPQHAEVKSWTRSQAHRNYFDPKYANWDLREITT